MSSYLIEKNKPRLPRPGQRKHRKRCRHCREGVVSRPRGLCWNCFHAWGVRNLYPVSNSVFARRGVKDFDYPAPLPMFPTQAEPGSPEKVRVLMQRADRREQLFHPEDRLAG